MDSQKKITQEKPLGSKETQELPKKDPAQKGASQKEYGGPKGPEPTRFGDWEIGGRCSDF